MAAQTFDSWLNHQTASEVITSARRLGLEAGLDPGTVSHRLTGTAMPTTSSAGQWRGT